MGFFLVFRFLKWVFLLGLALAIVFLVYTCFDLDRSEKLRLKKDLVEGLEGNSASARDSLETVITDRFEKAKELIKKKGKSIARDILESVLGENEQK